MGNLFSFEEKNNKLDLFVRSLEDKIKPLRIKMHNSILYSYYNEYAPDNVSLKEIINSGEYTSGIDSNCLIARQFNLLCARYEKLRDALKPESYTKRQEDEYREIYIGIWHIGNLMSSPSYDRKKDFIHLYR